MAFFDRIPKGISAKKFNRHFKTSTKNFRIFGMATANLLNIEPVLFGSPKFFTHPYRENCYLNRRYHKPSIEDAERMVKSLKSASCMLPIHSSCKMHLSLGGLQ